MVSEITILGKGRYKQQRSPWDTIHPGRAWADKLRRGKPEKVLVSLLQDFFSGRPVYTISTEEAVMGDEG